MLAAWMRNWLVGSAYRVDEAAVQQRGKVVHSPPSAGGLWAELRLEEQSKEEEGEGEGEGDGCVEWGVDLPRSARELLMEIAPSGCPPSPMNDDSDAGDGCTGMAHDAGTSSGGNASHDAPMEVEREGNVGGTLCQRRFTIEVTLLGGGGRAVCGVRSFKAPEGKVLIPKGLFQVGVQLSEAAVVRGVSLPDASSVVIGSEVMSLSNNRQSSMLSKNCPAMFSPTYPLTPSLPPSLPLSLSLPPPSFSRFSGRSGQFCEAACA